MTTTSTWERSFYKEKIGTQLQEDHFSKKAKHFHVMNHSVANGGMSDGPVLYSAKIIHWLMQKETPFQIA